MECIAEDEKVTVKAEACKKSMSLKVEESAAITQPEDAIRNLKVLKERIEEKFE